MGGGGSERGGAGLFGALLEKQPKLGLHIGGALTSDRLVGKTLAGIKSTA
jgi:hypothetical protein